MIRHIALFRFKEGISPETIDHIDATLATLPDIIPELIAFASGRDAGITQGSWDYAVVSDLASVEDYRAYATHPDHVDIVKTVVGPHVEQVARVQFAIT
jgi:hypothetical protein